MADKKLKTYKTVKKLVDAYASGELSARKNRPFVGNGDIIVHAVDDPDAAPVFLMSVELFIAQLAKLGEVKLPKFEG